MGFARLGLPDLYIPNVVPETDLQDARYLMRAMAMQPAAQPESVQEPAAA